MCETDSVERMNLPTKTKIEMKNLKEIASAEEISHLIANDLILEKHITEAPAEVRELSAKETEVEFADGLVVTIYDAVEPTAEWK
jgi:hypothetical protein